MIDRSFVKGNTPEEKFKSINKMFERFSRRLHKSVLMVTPPSVIGNYEAQLPADGIVLRAILPCDGTIDGLSIHCTSTKKTKTFVYILNKGEQKVYSSDIQNPLPVAKGDMVAVQMESEEPISNIWVSILFATNYLEGKKEQVAIEHFDKVIEDLTEGE
jgi:hypothetical protein